ncbi:hypothetical protein [Polaromonas aquatica]|uniref:hypothetical protein n=1 Tax=Polaromonas aquatica TaxID=332657 RepID=UPI003D6488BA
MRATNTLLTLLASALLAGCVTTPLDISNYQKVGVDQKRANTVRPFALNLDFVQPAHFRAPPGEVAAWFGPLCHPQAHYNCTYLADQDAYYILPDFGVAPSWSFVPSRAAVIVDGRTGQLLKSPAKP